MLFNILLCFLFISITYSSSITSIVSKTASTTIKPATIAYTNIKDSEKKIKLVSEGGSELPVQALPTLNETALDLDIEAGRNKEKPIKARKGAFDYSVENGTSTSYSNSSVTVKETSIPNVTKEPLNKTTPISSVNNTSTLSNKVPGADYETKTTVHKKPLKVVYETLQNYTNNMSSEVITNGPTLGKDVKKYSTTDVKGHPGMVMPFVITILVVPMFAVLGIMAIRKGQEAWKNRHYKRMDFLLDGMYND